ncbi:hypothetical protein AGABI2DRAFT_207725 [Agaricus bisporus var. bisporus H97]|uniref:hypothetical protein n=1 Tax=Agaricus bisporus var. bisporus (strain H97 / ATCC MYA-4626 / FGSC 10389) TaxID=936046 RepID=UPI00029F77F1|nr:hypothetical protein AGABI2DRAFT_207725 [Agaricus bisporus var. bisporus H97]EKV44885.1 hypothetical protein AGABI2DRAFT_207725 [Agaricus bisporus var. bisporus H97]
MSSAERRFPITAAQLVGNFCETLLYGMYLVTCGLCARAFLFTGSGKEERWLRPHEIRWMMVFIATTLLAICSFDVAIGLLHNFQAFIQSTNPSEEYYDIGDWINISRIYRCWIVHGHRWLIIVPSLVLYLGGISMAVRLIQVEADPGTMREISVVSNQLRPWLLAFFAITAAQNALTTSVIIWRIWRVDSRSSVYFHSGSTVNQTRYLRKVMRVIAESGAVYTLMVFLTFILCITGSNALYPMSDMTLQATGIAFNVILIRSPTRRDKQFNAFEHNTRASILVDQHAVVDNTAMRSISMARQPSHPPRQAVKSLGSRARSESSASDLHSDGIVVSKTVLTS